MYKRNLHLQNLKKSFFLWGQRQTGKTSLLKQEFPQALRIDLLKTEELILFAKNPETLRQRCLLKKPEEWIVIDEIQKVPALLSEVHFLIEEKKLLFALCGSSARGLRKKQTHLLGGRANRYELLGFSYSELKEDFDLIRILNRGYIPSHYLDSNYFISLKSYTGDYLKEEILNEGIIRNLQILSRFLEIAVFSEGGVLNFSTIGRDVGATVKTIQSYYEILSDTLVGTYVQAYSKNLKRKKRHAPKFFFHDIGIVNSLKGIKELVPKTADFGHAFENFIFHELYCFMQYSQLYAPITYFKLDKGEVDFILGDHEFAIEVKATSHIQSDHLKGLRALNKENLHFKSKIIVCLEQWPRKTEDGILILPYEDFLKRLWSHSLCSSVQLSFEE